MNGETIKPFEELISEEYGAKGQDNVVQKASFSSPSPKREATAKESKVVYALDVEGVIDVLTDGSKLVYLTCELEVVESITLNGQLYQPPPNEKCPYLFPRKEEVLGLIKNWNDSKTTQLYEDLRSYHKGISELPDEDFYDLLVIWDFHTWILEKSYYSPFLYFYAVKERGKSRTVKGMVYVARRGIFTETVREADILRWGNDHKAVLGFDTRDFPKKIEKANCDDLILTRFERGAIASRTLWPEKGAFNDTKNFLLFGATVIATNRPVDDILESRAIPIGMKPTDMVFGKPVLPEDAIQLKTKLAAFRAVNYLKDLEEAEPQARGRLGDITLPLYQIVLSFFPDKESIFKRLLEKIQAQKKEQATDTLEAQILGTVIGLQAHVHEGKLSVEIITSTFNEGRKENFFITSQTVGNILKGLGFDKRRMTGGKSGIYFDPELVRKLALQYGLGENEDSEESESVKDTVNVANELTKAQQSYLEQADIENL